MTTGEMSYQCYIDGKWIDSEQHIAVENPATGEIFARVPDCTTEHADEALASSQQALQSWKMLPAIERGRHIFRLIETLKPKRDHFARLLVLEQGKTLNEAYGEFDDTLTYLTYSAEAARRLEGKIFPSDNAGEQLWIQKVPYGVTIGLCAFNYPLALIGRKVGPALVTGNTIIVKPHEATPVTAMEFAKAVEEAGIPQGVINVISGSGIAVGEHLVKSPITQLVTLTGSIRAGQAICRAVAENITAVSLELGGKASFIVLEDADIDKAADAVVTSRYANCGQVCICAELVLVHEKVAEEFTRKVVEKVKQLKVGDPMDNPDMGPSVTAQNLNRVETIVRDTIESGAKLACGGERPQGAQFEKGNWYLPTVLTEVTPDMAAAREEIFGPVLPIVKIKSYDDAVAINNRREDGLSCYLWTNDYRTIMDGISRLEVGTVFVNKQIVGYIQGYHSGHKRSGIGGEDGVYGIEGYLQKRTVYLDSN
ncbi:lactaldehyde dehydrogenase / glycolaldehyde dehydrogenase [Microbulbifer thermotolerans]|uniref:aldehyde dehydrogenase family protein n=1 Tax=Microbulbifer thermotolerans TaxID=252514 RepID=UPI0008E3877F|nr:aldehyde dehydrogenase family protein [Microbulbifer thermotolerans]SFC76103.1 lactaldehyde dehydrogenase / glycolaldehyde dehydrogenase [Microbulbifer thermotolerans]